VEAIPYRGRFAPSPTGPLHAGSLVAALASWLDAHVHDGQWLVRLEDVDTPRCLPGADQTILAQLADCGLRPDEPPVYQTPRGVLYQQALDQLAADGWAYPCGCTRQDIERALAASGQLKPRHAELVYPGTCRDGLHGQSARAWRFFTEKYEKNRVSAGILQTHSAVQSAMHGTPSAMTGKHLIAWHDRRLGNQTQHVSRDVGDFVLRRADGFWAYQLAVVVDDAAQGITHVVRGEDLADNTARQILLQNALGLPTPQYLHVPLVLGSNGEKLSKQNGAQALDTSRPLAALNQAAAMLGLPAQAGSVPVALAAWLMQWHNLWASPRHMPITAPEAPG